MQKRNDYSSCSLTGSTENVVTSDSINHLQIHNANSNLQCNSQQKMFSLSYYWQRDIKASTIARSIVQRDALTMLRSVAIYARILIYKTTSDSSNKLYLAYLKFRSHTKRYDSSTSYINLKLEKQITQVTLPAWIPVILIQRIRLHRPLSRIGKFSRAFSATRASYIIAR